MTRHYLYRAVFFFCMLAMAGLTDTGYTAERRWLAEEQILLYGLGLRAEPEHQTVPKDIATVVSTYLQAPDTIPQGVLPIPADAQVYATLRGPSLPGPVELVTRVNAHFEISPLQRAGIHTLENIRIVREGFHVSTGGMPGDDQIQAFFEGIGRHGEAAEIWRRGSDGEAED